MNELGNYFRLEMNLFCYFDIIKVECRISVRFLLLLILRTVNGKIYIFLITDLITKFRYFFYPFTIRIIRIEFEIEMLCKLKTTRHFIRLFMFVPLTALNLICT